MHALILVLLYSVILAFKHIPSKSSYHYNIIKHVYRLCSCKCVCLMSFLSPQMQLHTALWLSTNQKIKQNKEAP